MEPERRDRGDRDYPENREDVEIGRKGGAASMAAGMPGVVARETVAFWTRDLVRWGPIWAGLLIALSLQLVLGTIGLAVALSSNNPASANFAENVARTLSIWSAISALIALFVGGFVSGRMAAVLGLKNGLVQGSVVWALALLIGIVLSALGVAGFLGAAMNISPLISRGLDVSGPEGVRLIRGASSAAWWFVAGAVLAWIAAAGGGILGAAAHTEEIEQEVVR